MLPSPELTIRNVRRDFSEWHLGRPAYALWALELDMPPVRRLVAAARRHLAPFLLAGYRRQPHLTLGLCGFPCVVPGRPDDFGRSTFLAQFDGLRRLRQRPFDLSLGPLDTFASAPYVGVQGADGALAALHRCLSREGWPDPEGGYVPHVTVGLYADAWPMARVRERLAVFRHTGDAPRLRVDRIGLLTYAAPVIGGVLTRVAHWDLADDALHWCPAQSPDVFFS